MGNELCSTAKEFPIDDVLRNTACHGHHATTPARAGNKPRLAEPVPGKPPRGSQWVDGVGWVSCRQEMSKLLSQAMMAEHRPAPAARPPSSGGSFKGARVGVCSKTGSVLFEVHHDEHASDEDETDSRAWDPLSRQVRGGGRCDAVRSRGKSGSRAPASRREPASCSGDGALLTAPPPMCAPAQPSQDSSQFFSRPSPRSQAPSCTHTPSLAGRIPAPVANLGTVSRGFHGHCPRNIRLSARAPPVPTHHFRLRLRTFCPTESLQANPLVEKNMSPTKNGDDPDERLPAPSSFFGTSCDDAEGQAQQVASLSTCFFFLHAPLLLPHSASP
eukprot:Tamp_04260.p1 GENE.Tamp_04260~~Tamp_04260.p1  ORF type:complete len:350 (+),score=18.36 Tamp_04260:61-1050(+)